MQDQGMQDRGMQDPRPLRLPAALDGLRGGEAGRQWVSALPDTLAAVAADWSLRVGQPYGDSKVSVVMPATLPDGGAAVLKLQYPDRESEHEAATLRYWDGDGAVRLLASDPDRRALLVEHCSPGDYLAGADPDEALSVFAGLLPRLCRPARAPFTPLAREARRWAEDLPDAWEHAGRPCERRLVDAAADELRGLAGDGARAGGGALGGGGPDEQVLLHQDLHGYNVLSAAREPWLAIDPKPLVGDRAFAIAPIVRDYELGHGREQVRHRLDRLSAEFGVDRERACRWTFGQTMVWALRGGTGMPYHLETARWLLEPR